MHSILGRFAAVLLLCIASSVATEHTTNANTRNLIPTLLGVGSEQDYLDLFQPGATIDDVFAGRVSGSSATFLAFRASFQARLAPTRPLNASIQMLRVTHDVKASRTAVEQLLPLASGWAWDECKGTGKANTSAEMLFTTVAELSPSGKLLAVRLYYPSYPMMGASVTRGLILPKDASAKTTGEVEIYQTALRLGDANAIATAFEADGYFREPAGVYHSGAYSGVISNFRAFFSFGKGGGIDLDHCAVTTDGVAYVLEYNCVGWGGVVLEPNAGVATYELGRSSHIMSARVNDNVSPPPPSG